MSRKLLSTILCVALVSLIIPLATAGTSGASSVIYGADNPNPPTNTTKLVFIHHSCGANWLEDGNGRLGGMLQFANYFVSDTNYGWGPDSIGDNTDIGQWWSWFRGPNSATYTTALYNESGQNSTYSRLASDPGGENKVIMFKSCYPNSNLEGNPNDPVPPIASNPLKGNSGPLTVANAKGIYIDLLEYFKTRTDKLFIAVTAPPVQDPTYASNARAFNNWLVNDWLDGYAHNNVFVFDFYNVLTSNGGNPYVNDIGAETGNHHRWYNDAVQHKTDGGGNTAAYADGDDHPTAEGNQKGTAEFAPLLNVAYNRFTGVDPDPPPPPPPPGPSTRQCAHDSIGVTEADYTWFLAEGCTDGGFETWVLVQNPGTEDRHCGPHLHDRYRRGGRSQPAGRRWKPGNGQRVRHSSDVQRLHQGGFDRAGGGREVHVLQQPHLRPRLHRRHRPRGAPTVASRPGCWCRTRAPRPPLWTSPS